MQHGRKAAISCCCPKQLQELHTLQVQQAARACVTACA